MTPDSPTAPSSPAKTEFRADIEGLRAVAVLLVVFFHAGVPAFTGGFVGVDVFFVISGFLITGLIVREMDVTGTVSLSSFYARRARRLLPAAAVVLLAVLAASALFMPLLRIPPIAADVASASAYVSNIRFGVVANDYFHQGGPSSPVLHFWSLSVEEQFYIFWPAVLLLLFRVSRGLKLPAAGLVAGIGFLTCLSFAGCLALGKREPTWAFYLLPTRAWELGVGGLITLAVPWLSRSTLGIATGAVWAGVAMITAASVLFDSSTHFPGSAALLPVVGAALVIAGGLGRSLPFPSKILGVAPMRFLGRISYSIYLWHWPILLFAGIGGAKAPLTWSIPAALLSIVLAAITQRLVESPFRRGWLIGQNPRTNLIQAVGLVVVFVALSQAGSSAAQSVAAVRLASLEPKIGNVKPQPPHGWCDVAGDVPDRGKCVHGDLSSGTTVVLFGDSRAEQWFPAFNALAEQHRWRFVSLTLYGCTSVDTEVAYEGEAHCPAWRTEVIARIAAERPALVVLSNIARTVAKVGDRVFDSTSAAGEAVVLEKWGDAVDRTLKTLAGLAGRTAILGETPAPGEDVPTCLAAHPDDFAACARPADSIPTSRHSLARKLAERPGGAFIDPTPWLCPNRSCPVVMGNLMVYWDASHLSGPFSRSLADKLGAELLPLVRAPK